MNSNPGMPSRLLLALCMALPQVNMAADIIAQPPAGGGFAVRNSGNTTDRFRVDEAAGTVSIPGLNGADAQEEVTCFDAATGQLGPCSGSLTGATGATGQTGGGCSSSSNPASVYYYGSYPVDSTTYRCKMFLDSFQSFSGEATAHAICAQ